VHLLTPPGCGGVAVVVAVAAGEQDALLCCLRTLRGEPVRRRAGKAPLRAQLHWDGAVRDDVLVVDRGPLGLEVHVHGSPALIGELARRIGPLQPLPASPAELLLRTALSPAQLRLAIEQLACDFAAFCARCARLPPGESARELTAALRRTDVALALAEPQRLVLVGRQNAGKSTLFNRLLFRERALTGPLPGLTRDPVVEVACLADYPYELVDTAGEGPVATPADAAALARARAATGMRVLVVDSSVGPTPADRALLRAGTIVVATKADLRPGPWPADFACDLRVAATDAASALRSEFGELLRRRRGLPPAGPVGGPAALTAADADELRRLASATGLRPA